MILVRHALGEVLRRHRTEQGRTLRDVADAARVSLGYLSEIERGQKEPSSELLYAVCDALGVPLSAVLAEAGEHVRAREGASDAVATRAPGRPERVLLGSSVLSRPVVTRPGVNRPGVTRPGPDRPVLNRPALDRPALNRPVLGRPAMSRSGVSPSPTRVVLSRPAPGETVLTELVSMPMAVTEPRLDAERLVLTSLVVPTGAEVSDPAVRARELAHAAA